MFLPVTDDSEESSHHRQKKLIDAKPFCPDLYAFMLEDLIECFKISVKEIRGEIMEPYLSQEIREYILRLHWAGYPFSAIAFKVSKTYHFSVTREMVDLLVSESLSKRANAKGWDSSASS